MLDLEKVDLDILCHALEDHSSVGDGWLFDPRTGDAIRAPETSLEDGWDYEVDPDELIPIEPIPSNESYGDLADFVATVRDPKARDLLTRAIAGRGAFRRFKDTLLDFPELRETWFAFHDARMERRAIEWLLEQGLVDRAQAETALAEHIEPKPPNLPERLDPWEVAMAVAADLRRIYGERLRHVLLFGSWARGDAHPESDIDLLIVLDRFDSRWDEHRRMDDVLWRHSLVNDTVVSAVVVSESEFGAPKTPTLINAVAEGRTVE